MSNPDTITAVSGAIVVLVTILTAWKQYCSSDINNDSLDATLTIAVLATVGGLNDFLNFVPFDDITQQWIRFVLTFVTAFINVTSKEIWPVKTEIK